MTSLLQQILPFSLSLVMFGIGLHLTINDFTRYIKSPKPIILGLITQTIILPAICFLICRYTGLSNQMSLGLMLLSASPGGVTANIFSSLFKGDVALNVSLTALNSIFIIFTMPIIVNLSLDYFLGESKEISLIFSKLTETVFIVVIPVSIGMFLNKIKPKLSFKLEKVTKVLSIIILLLITLAILGKEKQVIMDSFIEVAPPTALFCVLSLLIGYFVGKFAKLNESQSRALSFEIGIHNATLSGYLAISVLNDISMAVPTVIYSLWMFILATLFGFLLSRITPINKI